MASPEFDRELIGMTKDARQLEWVRRIEAVLFASATPVSASDLARVVGEGASVEVLIDALQNDLSGRPYEVVVIDKCWTLHTRTAYAGAIRAAADVGRQRLELNAYETAVLAAIAYHQPITRKGLKDIFGKEVNRELIGRLSDWQVITAGPRSPRQGAPYTFVTTEAFLKAFGLESLRDLPDREQLADAGLRAFD